MEGVELVEVARVLRRLLQQHRQDLLVPGLGLVWFQSQSRRSGGRVDKDNDEG